MPVAKKLASALFPVTFGHSALGGPSFLVLFSSLYWALVPLVRSCLFLFVRVRACRLLRFPLLRRGFLGSWPELPW